MQAPPSRASTPLGCAWTASSNDSWIRISAGASGSGNGTVNYSVALNEGTQRTGTITVAGQTLTVYQGGCFYYLSGSERGFAAAGGTADLIVYSDTGCDWTAVASDSWITITSGGSGAATGMLTYSVSANSGSPRRGTITVEDQSFTVLQRSTAPLSLVVTNTNDSGPGSFRQALLDGNGNFGQSNSIAFNIAGALTINLTTAVPEISNTVVINGINTDGNRAVLNGASTSTGYGVITRAPNCLVRGLVIQHFRGGGMYLGEGADNAVIENCSIETNGTGLEVCSNNNRIGGTTPGAANTISGNGYAGINFYCGAGTQVQGNYIGTNAAGADFGNAYVGIEVTAGSVTIGGTSAGAGNTIAFNRGFGVAIYYGTRTVVRETQFIPTPAWESISTATA